MKNRRKQTCLYVVELEHGGESWIKVGMTADKVTRFSSLQIGSPIDYSRLYFANIHNIKLLDLAEQAAHVALKDRSHRGEWFTGSANHATLGKIAVACAMHGIEIEWEEYFRSSMTAVTSIKRAEKLLARQRVCREERAEAKIERIRESVRYQPTMRDISNVYRKPILKLKSI